MRPEAEKGVRKCQVVTAALLTGCFGGLQFPTFRNLLVPLQWQPILEPSHIHVLLDIGEQFRERYFQILLDTKHVAPTAKPNLSLFVSHQI
jgi:hypothetical protein